MGSLNNNLKYEFGLVGTYILMYGFE